MALTLKRGRGAVLLDKDGTLLDDVPYNVDPWVRHPCAPAMPASDLALIARLLEARFDAAVIFTVYSQSALPAAMMCWFAGIPLRLAHCRENPYQLLTDRVAETEPHAQVRHEVARQMALVRSIGATTGDRRMTFDPGYAARRTMHARLRAALQRLNGASALPDRLGRWLVVHPGASAPSRRWPADRFGDAVARIAPLFDGVAVTGGDAEQALVASVCERAGPRAVGFAGTLSIGEFGALIEAADLLISNNSGPVHLAAALGTPVVDLYALTNPQHTPWRVPHRVLNVDVPCRHCYRSVCDQPGHPCLLGVRVDDVVAAVHDLLRSNARRAMRPRRRHPAPGGPAGVVGVIGEPAVAGGSGGSGALLSSVPRPDARRSDAARSNVIPFAYAITRS